MNTQAVEAHPKVVVRKIVRADRERVFDAWTKPELMKQWLFPSGGAGKSANDLRVGGTYSHEMIVPNGEATCVGGTVRDDGSTSYPHNGEYLEIRPPERLVFSWNSVAVSNTRVTIELRTVPEGTEITLIHELLPDETQRRSHTEGWNDCLANLEIFLSR
jgi:glutathione S-transferase